MQTDLKGRDLIGDLALQDAVPAGESDESQVGGVEHDFHGQEHYQQVLLDQEGHDAQHEQKAAQDKKP